MTIMSVERTSAVSSRNGSGSETQIPIWAAVAQTLATTRAVTYANSTRSYSESFPLRLRTVLDDIDSLIETLEIMTDTELLESIRRGAGQSAEGLGQDLDDVFAELGWE